MKNKELLNICYKFFNKFIDSNKLIELLKNIDTKSLSKNDIKKTAELINEISNIVEKYSSEEKGLETEWIALMDCINNNEYFNKCFENLTDYELLEFIAQYICAPLPPYLEQEQFDRLVKTGIEHDKREWLWRLAFNYERYELNFDLIVDYYIEKKDGYYIAELISAVGDNLDVDSIIDKINDKSLIEDLRKIKGAFSNHVTEEQFNKLISKLN